MTSQPLVTIVTPSYNQGHFIRATIESVLSQDYPNIEYIVMDGGSTDQTSSIVREYAGRLTFLSERDRGQSDAINKGFRRGRGEILAWMNSDDIYLPGAVSAAVRAFLANPGCGMVYGEGCVMGRDGKIQGRFEHSQPFDLWRLVHLSDYILQQSTFFSRAALDDVGYLDENLHYGMDWDIFIRIGLKYPVCHIYDRLGCIREYGDTKTSSGGLVRARELHAMLQKHTRMRLPPGSVVYCGGTYLGIARSWLDQNIPPSLGLVSRTARFALGIAARYTIGRATRHSQGLYAGGWAGRELRLMLHAGGGSFALSGALPPRKDRRRGQRLTLHANGLMLGRYEAPFGEFELHVPVPRFLNGRPLDLLVSAKRLYPVENSAGESTKRAFVFQGVRWL